MSEKWSAERDPVASLFSLVATHLAGRRVDVRLRRPVVRWAMGQVHKPFAGFPVIDLDPNITSEDELLFIFLHEVAHVVNDLSWMQKTDDARMPAGSMKIPEASRRAWSASAPERLANEQAERWKEYAEANCWRYATPGYTPLVWKLLALLDYVEVKNDQK